MDILTWNKQTRYSHDKRGSQKMNKMNKITIVKVGGAVVEDSLQLSQLLKDFSNIEGYKILVHGGGRRATKVATSLGIESKMVNGRRITNKEMLEVVTMVYGGLVNKNIVALLESLGENALGITGADMDIIRSHKRPLKNGIDFGYVGDVDHADGNKLANLIKAGIIPIIAPLTHDNQGNILNTNADTIASETAKALTPYFDVTLIYSFEKKGVLSNPNDENSVIPCITHEDFTKYIAEGVIAGGMIPKLENAFAAINAGVKEVIITLASAIDSKHGTIIK